MSRELLGGDRAPHVVDQRRRIAGGRVERDLQVLGPQPAPCGCGESWIVDDEVHLRVVEQRVLVEVRRPEGQPTVVDDADLGVDVYGLCRTTATRNERAAQQ